MYSKYLAISLGNPEKHDIVVLSSAEAHVMNSNNYHFEATSLLV